MIHTLIIPDVHGRDFWRDSVIKTLTNTSANIVFLGDYTDPYGAEWPNDFDYLQHTVDNFKEILNLKRQNPDRVILLIGNHDCGYCLDKDICSSRRDYMNGGKIRNLFKDNWEMFQLAEEVDIAGKHFIFSHAGISKGWADLTFGEGITKVVDNLNNALQTYDWKVLDKLGMYDRYRGYGGGKFGSPVWSDIRSWMKTTPEETFGFNIVGHTQLESDPIVFDTIADLDCRKAFYLDGDGIIRDYASDTEVQKTETQE